MNRDGLRKVTKEEFYLSLKSDQRDIMPSVAHSPRYDPQIGYVSKWLDRNGKLFGLSDNTGYWLV